MPAYRWFPTPALPDIGLLTVALAAVRAVSFWVAIVLVLVYPVALALPEAIAVEHIVALLLTHSAAVVLGHEHARRQD